ncbi:MAG TPA: transaldolase family protein [Candidatus Sulfotelmatobacter sp.]|jgi:transaldolase|nr:transaldolase family protein [Candidatus Sulfotelmatobacter sp.]
MAKPSKLRTKIFLDSADPMETKKVLKMLGFLDGQTTNPTLVSKNPEVKKYLEKKGKFGREDIYYFYKDVIKEISTIIPKGSISIEVYADASTSSQIMLTQGKEMFSWIPNAFIKYPITKNALSAAHQSIQAGIRVNMTLCFSQEQAAAVYKATKGAKKGNVYISPFIGRLDDKGQNGLDLIKNVLTLYKNGDGHVEVLAASVRTMYHFLYCLYLGVDIITAPFIVLQTWKEMGMCIPAFCENMSLGKPIVYQKMSIAQKIEEYNISHPLTTKGLQQFVTDWSSLVK